jgi:hypothetical protein
MATRKPRKPAEKPAEKPPARRRKPTVDKDGYERKAKYAPLDPDQVIAALEACHGLIAPAARALGTSRQAIYGLMKREPRVAEAVDAAREDLLDAAENRLREKAIVDGDTASLLFLLKCLGKQRGYVERQQVEHKTPGSDTVVIQIGKKK